MAFLGLFYDLSVVAQLIPVGFIPAAASGAADLGADLGAQHGVAEPAHVLPLAHVEHFEIIKVIFCSHQFAFRTRQQKSERATIL